MSRRSPLLVLAVLLGAALLAGTAVADSSAQATDDPPIESCAETPPADFADPEGGNGTIGWFDGYWYDEPIDVDATDGLDTEEFEALSARTAARLEAMRCLAFDELPPIEIQTREEFAEENADAYANVTEAGRLFDNAMLETMLLVGSETDAIDVREANRAVSVGGYYDILEDRIVVISDDPDSLSIDEEVLAHELGHALQGRHFDLASYPRTTTDRDKGTLGLIEGDTHRVERRYLEACEAGEWGEPCATDDGGEGNVELPSNMGLYFLQFQPYSDGPSFVERAYEAGGWEAVNALYDEPPTSALHVIEPETYGEVEPADLEVPDESDDGWERLTADDVVTEEEAELYDDAELPDYDVIGQAGLTAMFVDPAYSEDEQGPVRTADFFNRVGFSGVDPTDPYDYDQPETDGWRGDRLYVYAEAGAEGDALERETAAVWTLAWTDAAEAERFLGAYEDLLELRGAERVDGYAHTYEFAAESEFDGAVALEPEGDRLWVVTAPSVDDLTAVHDVDLLEAGDGVGGEGADDAAEADDERGADGDDPTETETDRPTETDDGDELPGFGAAIAAFALLAAVLALARRR